MSLESVKTFTSFSGADLIVSFGPKVIGELQQISWAIQREKAPVYTFGSPDPRSFSRGKRGIAGSLIFAVFNRDALLQELKKIWTQIAPPNMFTAKGNIYTANNENFTKLLTLAGWNAAATATNPTNFGTGYANEASVVTPKTETVVLKDEANPAGLSYDVVTPPGFGSITQDNIIYIDQIPPFDVTLTFANEYGQAAFQKIYDVDILNEGSGVSVDTIVMERQVTYIARRISPILEGVYTRDASGNVTGNVTPYSKK